MAYKSLLTILTRTEDVARTLESAVALARQHDAHLDVLCIGVDTTQIGYYYESAAVFVQQTAIDRAREQAEATLAAVRARLEREDLRWGAEAAVAQMGSLGALVALRSRFTDLVLVPRPYSEARDQELEVVLEAALFEGQAPVFVLPATPLTAPVGRRILLAWNQSDEALSAAHKALPLLIAAERVVVTVIDPPKHGPERSDPGGALSQWLARHGVRVEVAVLAKTLPRVSEVLARQARDLEADLIVMGAYGHSRFREAILGGATRNMLETSEIPVLMAH